MKILTGLVAWIWYLYRKINQYSVYITIYKKCTELISYLSNAYDEPACDIRANAFDYSGGRWADGSDHLRTGHTAYRPDLMVREGAIQRLMAAYLLWRFAAPLCVTTDPKLTHCANLSATSLRKNLKEKCP